MNDKHERRLVRRHNVGILLKYRLWKTDMPEMHGQALNLSESGVYFATNSVAEKGEILQVRFRMPEGIVDEPPAEWLCTGQVVRVDRVGGLSGKLGIAVKFDCYEIARPEGRTAIHLEPQSFRLGFFSRPPAPRTSVVLRYGPEDMKKKLRGQWF